MAKIIEYPRAPLDRGLETAQAVYELGGTCSEEMCAEKLGKKMSGAFQAQISATIKYGLIEKRKGQLVVTGLYRDFKMAYSDDEAKSFLKKAFLNVPTFRKISERFDKQKIPVSILDKLLVRECDVHQNEASKVSGYFLSGAKRSGLMDESDTICLEDAEFNNDLDSDNNNEPKETVTESVAEDFSLEQSSSAQFYTVKFCGPGVNTTLEIHDEDDLIIVEAFLKKIKKNLLA
jgi:hypothetical protein